MILVIAYGCTCTGEVVVRGFVISLQCVLVWCSMLCVCDGVVVLQCVAVCCSVLQCVT